MVGPRNDVRGRIRGPFLFLGAWLFVSAVVLAGGVALYVVGNELVYRAKVEAAPVSFLYVGDALRRASEFVQAVWTLRWLPLPEEAHAYTGFGSVALWGLGITVLLRLRVRNRQRASGASP